MGEQKNKRKWSFDRGREILILLDICRPSFLNS